MLQLLWYISSNRCSICFIVLNCFLGPYIEVPPSPTQANKNLTISFPKNYLLYWDMGKVYDTSLNTSVTPLNSMNYLFGLAFPPIYSNTAISVVVEQFSNDFLDIINVTASASVPIGVSTNNCNLVWIYWFVIE